MPTVAQRSPLFDVTLPDPARPPRVRGRADVGLLTGGIDRPYALGLAKALLSKDVCVDFVASDDLESAELRRAPRLNFLNLRGDQREDASVAHKIWRILAYYARLLAYAWAAEPKVLHILWNNKFEFLDRTLLMLYYRLRRKKIVLTAHNVNAGRRDANDSPANRLSLSVQYTLAHHIFVHTAAMKAELLEAFPVPDTKVTVIPLGINDTVPNTDMTPEQAKRLLGIERNTKAMLFFGQIGPYKGLEFLVAAFQQLAAGNDTYRLIIAGKPKQGSERYLEEIQTAIARGAGRKRILQRIQFIPHDETEVYFKAADAVVLPYISSSQSGVLILGYSFGVPVIAADVGSFREDIVEGQTGFLCSPRDSVGLAKAIEAYFDSDLFRHLDERRAQIRRYANERFSWNAVGAITKAVYEELRRQ
jgi:D-inositol-3-phosphate glycosyltransferase